MILRWREIACGFALALALMGWLGCASASSTPLVLDSGPHQRLDGYLAVLEDPTGTLELAAVRRADRAGRFVHQTGGGVSFGYRPGAIWVRFTVSNPTSARQQRWLALENPFLVSCIMHWLDAAGAITVLVNGAVVPIGERPLAARKILFPLDIAAGEVQTGYLRIGGPSLKMSELSVWQPVAYAEEQSRRQSVKALVIAASVLSVAFFGVLAWRSNGRLAMLAVGLGDVCFGIVTFMLDGVGAGWVPVDHELWQHRLLGGVLLLGLFFHIVFARAFLDLPKVAPRLATGMAWLAILCLLIAAMQGVFLGVNRLVLVAALLLTATMGVVVLLAAWRSIRNARRYLLAWGALLMVVLVRSAAGIFEAPTLLQGNDLPLVGFMVSTLVLGHAMYRDVQAIRAAGISSHDRLQTFQRNEQARLAAAVESRTAELREAKRVAEATGKARLAFLSTVSHELRTPLHTIVGYAQLLRKGGRRQLDSKLHVIETSGLQLLYLIDQMLQFIRGDDQVAGLRPERVSLALLVGQLEDTGLLLAAAGGNHFIVKLAKDLPAVVEVDEHRLLQVLTNLIGNACKYTAQGTVTLRIDRQVVLDDDAVPVGSQCLRFAVEDTGVGISVEHHARIFEPFSRAPGTEHQPGVGLGLTIARQAVRAMGGEIELESEPGHGSCFHFSLVLPVPSDGESPLPRVDVPRIIGHTAPQRSLLVVDDITENRLFLRDLCGEWGFRVLTANDGAEALATCRVADMDLACVLVDQFMPVLDGWGFLGAVRTSPAMANLPVILISAAEPERPKGFPADINFDHVLLKPMRHQDLADYLQKRLNLQWILEDGPSAEHAEQVESLDSRIAAGAAGDGLRLPAIHLEALREMLVLGRVVSIRRWAEELAKSEPELESFAAEVVQLAERVDLLGLRQLLARSERGGAAFRSSEVGLTPQEFKSN